MDQCIVCTELTNKYKCPKCFVPYCSLACFKQHKDNTCAPNETKTAESLEIIDIEEEPTVHEPFKTEDAVQNEKLQQLDDSKHLKNLLCNPHLRNLLKEIDTAPSAWNAIKAAMQEPLFLEFADECLRIVEPSTEVN